MQKKTRFIMQEFYTDYESPDNYIVLIETEDDKPVSSYVVKVPVPFMQFPRYPHIKN